MIFMPMMLERRLRRCMQVIKKVEWLKGSLLSFLSSSSHHSFPHYTEHSCNTFQKRISMYMGNLLSTMHASIKWKPLDFNQRSSPPPLLLPPDTSLYYGKDLLKMWMLPVTFESKKGTFKSSTSFFIAEYYVQRSGVCDAELFLMRHFSECPGMWTTSWSDTSVFNRPLTHSLWSTGTKKLP